MRKRTIWRWILVVILVVLSGLAFAQDEVQLLEKARALLTEGKLEEAQGVLEAVRLNLWNQLPMRIERVTFVEEEAQSFGAFRKRASDLFARGEKIFVYGEPKNYTILQEGDLYHIFFTTDFRLYDSQGNLLASQEEFGSFRYITQSPIFEAFLNLSFSFTGLEAGDYVLEVMLKDRLAEKSTSFKLPFKVR
ncbi:MAG: hypothetical protein ACP5Q4_07150 [Candidatus Caldatribacteriaceae bacterium]